MLQCFQRFQCFKTITARSTWKQKMIHPFHHRWLIDVSNPMSKIVQSCNQPDMSSPCECNPWRCKSCFSLFTFSKQVMPLLSHFFLSNPEPFGIRQSNFTIWTHFEKIHLASDSSIWRSCRAFTKNSKKQMPCLAKGLVGQVFFRCKLVVRFRAQPVQPVQPSNDQQSPSHVFSSNCRDWLAMSDCKWSMPHLQKPSHVPEKQPTKNLD